MLALTLMLSLTVVIDPGHGGSNTGAPARVAGTYEKQVTLAIARDLAARLRAEGVQVILTRDHDEYLTLRERSRRANALHPDCFVSVHANASPDHSRRGIETYVIARDAGDVDARRAAERAPRDGVTPLFAELAQLDAQARSVALARAIQSHLVASRGPIADEDRGVRQAAYDVLSGVKVPAVLVEVGFIDHPIEGVALTRPEVQERTAQAIADGILEFAGAAHPRLAALSPEQH